VSNQDSNPYESSGSPDGGTVAAESIPLSDPISVREKIGYGLGDTASNLYWKLFENFQLFFYTEVFGISSLAAGTMFFVTKLWDAINDPFVGFISDRTKTAWGRFRPYLLWMAIPFAVTGILTFYTPDFSPTGKLIYAYITYTLVFMAYTAINIPYGALMGVISTSSLERTTVSTYRFILAFIGGLVVQLCTLPLVEYFGGGKVMKGGVESVVDPQTGFFWTVVCYACAAVVLFLITFATTKERVQPEQKSKSNTFRQDVTDLMKNRPWIVLLFVGLFQILAGWTRGSATGYYFTYFVEVGDVEFPWMHDVASYFPGFLSFIPGFFIGILENPGSFGNFFAAGTVFSILGMFLTRPLVKIFGNKLLLLLVMVGNAICMAAFVGLAKDQWQMMYLIHVIGAFISGPMPILLWAMYADVADYSEWINKRRATGLIFAAATFSQKMGSALGGAVPGWALAAYSFQAPIDGVQQVQTENTIQGIILMMSLIPAVFLMGAVGALLFYNIDKRLMDQIEIDLQSRKSELKSKPNTSG
jgi:GPH family glycoside/pentoside/hexuronide:cation symporter